MTDDERLFKKESSQVVTVTERLDSKTPPQTPQPPSNQDVRNMFETALRNFAFYSRKMQFSDDDIHVTLKFIRCPSQVTKKAVSFQNADAVSSEAVFASRWLTRLLEYDRAVRKSTVTGVQKFNTLFEECSMFYKEFLQGKNDAFNKSNLCNLAEIQETNKSQKYALNEIREFNLKIKSSLESKLRLLSIADFKRTKEVELQILRTDHALSAQQQAELSGQRMSTLVSIKKRMANMKNRSLHPGLAESSVSEQVNP